MRTCKYVRFQLDFELTLPGHGPGLRDFERIDNVHFIDGSAEQRVAENLPWRFSSTLELDHETPFVFHNDHLHSFTAHQ